MYGFIYIYKRERERFWGLIVKDPVYCTNPCCIEVGCGGSLSSSTFWSVVRVVSRKTAFAALLCREFNLPSEVGRMIIVRFDVGIQEQFPGVNVYDVP